MSAIKIILAILATAAIAVGVGVDWAKSESPTRTLWQQAVIPDALSQSHAFLSNQCAACHTAVKGVEPALCIACHADNTSLLKRQPTAFHANIQVCSGCHVEHQGAARMPTTMDHALLSQVGHRELESVKSSRTDKDDKLSAQDIAAAVKLLDPASDREKRTQELKPGTSDTSATGCGGPGGCSGSKFVASPPGSAALPVKHPGVAAGESMLNCVSCHATKDRHQGMFGASCAQCHATTQWTVAQFRHPSTSSTECAQCHKPPPSHNMMHFSMMSAPMARQPNAKVNQCFLCHQSTSWNDIKGVGWIKHH